MVHKGKAWPGEHDAIMKEDLWERVQHRIAENRVERKLRRNAAEASLLAGMIFDGLGRKMSPSHTARKGKRYRYYITHASQIVDGTPAWRWPAHAIEKAVVRRLSYFLSDQSSVRRLVGTGDAGQLAAMIARCLRTAEQLKTSTFHRRTKVPALVERVDVADTAMSILFSHAGLTDFLGVALEPQQLQPLVSTISRVRKGQEVKLILSNEDAAERDQTLVSLLREAMSIRREVLSTSGRSIADLAASSGRCRKRLSRLLRLSWIAPEIVDAILAGQQPQTLTVGSLLASDLPADWSGQKLVLGSGDARRVRSAIQPPETKAGMPA